ncbi:MAG: ATP-binding protein [Treponema sp.]|nr:ATP-binding protein [Treponema sp.]
MAKLTVEATKENTGKVLAFVEAELEKLECPIKELAQINVAVDELYCNIASYAYPDSQGTADIIVQSPQDNTVAITFEDGGVPYDPLKKPDPDVTLSAEERKIGGLGIYIVKKTMDSVEYKYQDNKNVLTITKKW